MITYTYPATFGKETDATQNETDKSILKRLSQIHKESTIPFQTLLKKIRQETLKNMHLDRERKDSLAENLTRTIQTKHYTDYRKVPDAQGGSIQESLQLQAIPYSDIITKQENAHFQLAIKQTSYLEQCGLNPACTDCLNNGSYSTCGVRRPTKHTTDHTIPLKAFWAYALLGMATLP